VARLFAQGLQFVAGAHLVAIASRTPARLQDMARLFNVTHTYGRYEDLVGDPTVDVVYVATTNQVHKEHILLCLHAGKPVLCEKPFTLGAAEAREVIAVARQRRLFCMEAMWMRFMPLMAGLRELLDSNILGDIRLVRAELGLRFPFDKGNRFFNPALGGGAMLDLGVYPLSFASFVLGAPEKVISDASIGETEVDEQAAAILSYPAGKLALVSTSLVSDLPGGASIIGTKGQIKIHAPLYRPFQLSIAHSPANVKAESAQAGWRSLLKKSHLLRGMVRTAGRVVARVPGRRLKSKTYPFVGNGYNYEAAETMRCLRAGETESRLLPLDETISIMETLDSIRSQWAGSIFHKGEES
jgi:predicted dehydrogenase